MTTKNIVYINCRERHSIYSIGEQVEQHPLEQIYRRQHPELDSRDRPPSLAGSVVPRNIGNTFWGRVNSFDHKAVKNMLKKEPRLIITKWCNMSPLTCLFSCHMTNKTVKSNLDIEYYERHISRFNKMLRILLDYGCEFNSNDLLPYIERYPFHTEKMAKRTFYLLLHRGLYPDNYTLLDEEEIMLLEARKFLRNEEYVFWGRKVISDYIRYRKRLFYHVYLRELDQKPILNYDVIGVITSFL